LFDPQSNPTPMQYRLRTLLICLALGPPLLAAAWWSYPYLSAWLLTSGVGSLARLVFNIAYVALPVVLCAFVASRVAAAITKR
jgi:hypothetical protein